MLSERAEPRTGQTRSIAACRWSPLVRLAGVTAIALMAANCSSNMQGGIDPKYGVAPSPRVVRDGDPVPKGGGREQLGKPYTVAGRTYVPSANPNYKSEGLASWYGSNFHGRRTANGEVFDRGSVAAAHTTMPLPSYARVTNVQNGYSMIVRVNDRGPFHGNRIIDVSERAATALGFKNQGTARVRVDYVGRASTNGSDDRILLSSLRTDGLPAALTNTLPTMLADATPRPAPMREATVARAPEAVEQAEPVQSFASQRVATAADPVNTSMARSAPLPPERPFDLGTIPSAATPVRVSAVSTGAGQARSTVAGLYYAETETSRAMQKGSGFVSLDRSKFLTR
ncbi:septal ring lytic transglycosylase RlpA family protein [Microvirga antarctica]|uniref:septal ring lytic transglycosylase RlpA family protein n=1 Tax=Microvirga antarctica TaxID=2819233 RepID=UPI001B317BD1|nr:septal ring lytic transglycosylase RlpA family protein [Microvirga antarctica]